MNKQKDTYTAIKPKDYNDCKTRVEGRGWCIKDHYWYSHYTANYDLYLIYKNNRKKPSYAYTVTRSGYGYLYKAGSGDAVHEKQIRDNNPELTTLLDQLNRAVERGIATSSFSFWSEGRTTWLIITRHAGD